MDMGIACSLTQKDVDPHTEIHAAVSFKRSPSWSILEEKNEASCVRSWLVYGHLHNPLAICQVVKDFFSHAQTQTNHLKSQLTLQDLVDRLWNFTTPWQIHPQDDKKPYGNQEGNLLQSTSKAKIKASKIPKML